MADDLEVILDRWLDENVHNVPGLSDAEQLDAEIDRLRAKLKRDLDAHFTAIDATYELDDVLQAKLESVLDPELGFRDFD